MTSTPIGARFRGALAALRDCYPIMELPICDEEVQARRELIEHCVRIATTYGDAAAQATAKVQRELLERAERQLAEAHQEIGRLRAMLSPPQGRRKMKS